MDNQLSILLQKHPLPPNWKLQEFVCDKKDLWPLKLHVAGITAEHESGIQISGSAAELKDCSERAFYELLERIATVEATFLSSGTKLDLLDSFGRKRMQVEKESLFPQSNHSDWNYSKSNGVALDINWQQATQSAALELEERDRILRAWFQETFPTPINVNLSPAFKALTQIYEILVVSFPASPSAPSLNHVVGVFGFPRDANFPRINGFGAHPKLEIALQKAENECLQMLGFLLGEAWSAEELKFSPTPQFHLAYYSNPNEWQKLKSWLAGKEKKRFKVNLQHIYATPTLFANITPPAFTSITVVKAYDPGKIPLTFGYSRDLFSDFENETDLIHPIA